MNVANVNASVREGYLKAFDAASDSEFGWSIAAAANGTHELVAVGAAGNVSGGPYGDVEDALAMPYDTPSTGRNQPYEGAVYTYQHTMGSGVGTWRAAHRLKAPDGRAGERFGFTLTMGMTAHNRFLLGIGTLQGCRVFVVRLNS